MFDQLCHASDQMMTGMHYPHDTTGETPIRVRLFLKKLHVSSEQGIETFHPQMRTFGNSSKEDIGCIFQTICNDVFCDLFYFRHGDKLHNH